MEGSVHLQRSVAPYLPADPAGTLAARLNFLRYPRTVTWER